MSEVDLLSVSATFVVGGGSEASIAGGKFIFFDFSESSKLRARLRLPAQGSSPLGLLVR